MKKAMVLASVSSMIQQFNMNNIALLEDLGYEVHVLANFTDGGTLSKEKSKAFRTELVNRGITVFDVGINRSIFKKDNLSAYKEIKNIIDSQKYDLIHCHSPIGGVMTRLAARSHRKDGMKVMYTAHGFHFWKGAPLQNWLIFYSIEKGLSKHTDYLLTINEEDYQTSKERKFKAGKIIHINGIGIDTHKFSKPSAETKKVLREQYGYADDDFILIYVAELNANKNQGLLINMMKELVKDIPKARLLLVGRGDLQEDYAEQVKEAQLEKAVTMLGYREDVEKLMALSDVAVSSSRREGLPVNVMEAMASGLPLVVTDCRGNRELVRNDENGFVVAQDDSAAFVASLEKIYHSVELQQNFGEASLEMVKKYSKKCVDQQMQNIYGEATY